MDLRSQLELWDQEITEDQKMMMGHLDEAIMKETLLRLTTTDGKDHTLFPCKILHMEGHLSLIAEECVDHCLMIIPLTHIKGFMVLATTSKVQASSYEVEEFINAIRTMNESESRLILKIHDPDGLNLFPDYQFLGKPCMITNSQGDLIWAAYVEPCHSLFEWLISLGRRVEILDPGSFKRDYLAYVEDKLRKIA
jgi:hypothetical protein